MVKTIYALLSAKIIIVKPDQKPAGPVVEEDRQEGDKDRFTDEVNSLFATYETMGYYELLGLQKEATPQEVKEAFWKKTKQFHPDKHFSNKPDDIKQKLTKIFSRIGSAYSVLGHPEKRMQYDRSLKKNPDKTNSNVQIALELFQKGQSEMVHVKLYREFGEETHTFAPYLNSAIKLFFEAIYFDNSRAEYHYYYGVALSVKKTFKESVTAFNKAIELDPSKPEYFAELGHVLLELGFHHRAKSAFDRALKLSPSNKRALQGRRILSAP